MSEVKKEDVELFTNWISGGQPVKNVTKIRKDRTNIDNQPKQIQPIKTKKKIFCGCSCE